MFISIQWNQLQFLEVGGFAQQQSAALREGLGVLKSYILDRGGGIAGVRFGKRSHIINKQSDLRKHGIRLADLDRILVPIIHLFVNSSGHPFHANHKDIGRDRVPCLMPLMG
ncbi:hypothetical protein HAX54_004679 [Datura stramonium]|uniref:Uncharacterized protein n=1 Tax=Datura stramonium TaxID=4076 RepID=A0ABS8RX96_DATST|nr:hypothetical protein [Datura stramonium]